MARGCARPFLSHPIDRNSMPCPLLPQRELGMASSWTAQCSAELQEMLLPRGRWRQCLDPHLGPHPSRLEVAGGVDCWGQLCSFRQTGSRGVAPLKMQGSHHLSFSALWLLPHSWDKQKSPICVSADNTHPRGSFRAFLQPGLVHRPCSRDLAEDG